AVLVEVRVKVVAHDGSGGINPLAVGIARAVWSVEASEGAVDSPHEAVACAACIIVKASNGPRRVDALGNCKCGTKGIDTSDGAIGRPQEAVTYACCIKIGTRDRPGRVDGLLATRRLKKADIGTRGTRRIEGCESAVRFPEKCMKDRRVWVESSN